MDTTRRDFLIVGGQLLVMTAAAAGALEHVLAGTPEQADTYNTVDHWWARAIDIDKCIGCGNCVRACKAENDVPDEPYYFRTWVERYHVDPADMEHPIVDAPNGGFDGFSERYPAGVGKTFFVPKLCNHCAHSPCVQVCPVGATFETRDGVVLVDKDYCIGCRYCVQACPYGARWFNEEKGVSQKCYWCYHRITKGLQPACVEACPVGARVFGDRNDAQSPISLFIRNNRVQVLKPETGNEPNVFYVGIDRSVG
jgi:Fe-S-cluster-containing dehydrogenase component